MLVVDLMHEFEQGVWKVLFIHLLRMLDSKGSSLINELDLQYMFPASSTVLINMPLKGFDMSPRLVKAQSGSSHQMLQQ